MGHFDFFGKIGATPQAVAVFNDQPFLFTVLVVVLIGLAAEIGLVLAIHYLTRKPEQRRAKSKPESEKKPKPTDDKLTQAKETARL